MRKNVQAVAVIAAVTVVAASAATASEMVYHPVNPTFGGSSLNGTFLLSQAQAQGEGVKSGSQGPDLSGLNNALSNLGSGAVIIGGNGTGSSTSTGSSSTPSTTSNTVRAVVP
jgi:curli production assembly/transport component CsgF